MVATRPITLALRPVREETLTPAAYLRMLRKQPGNVLRAQVIPPKLGKLGFGKIRVIYRHPVLRAHGF